MPADKVQINPRVRLEVRYVGDPAVINPRLKDYKVRLVKR